MLQEEWIQTRWARRSIIFYKENRGLDDNAAPLEGERAPVSQLLNITPSSGRIELR
jgi:hypothetical protein